MRKRTSSKITAQFEFAHSAEECSWVGCILAGSWESKRNACTATRWMRTVGLVHVFTDSLNIQCVYWILSMCQIIALTKGKSHSLVKFTQASVVHVLPTGISCQTLQINIRRISELKVGAGSLLLGSEVQSNHSLGEWTRPIRSLSVLSYPPTLCVFLTPWLQVCLTCARS